MLVIHKTRFWTLPDTLLQHPCLQTTIRWDMKASGHTRHMLIVSRHVLFRCLKEDCFWAPMDSVLDQQFNDSVLFPVGGGRPVPRATADNDEWMAAKSEGRVSRADLHAHPQLMTVPPEVHASSSPPSLQIGSRDWHVWGHVLGPCDSNGLNLEIHFVV